jgi:hypothetical protein
VFLACRLGGSGVGVGAWPSGPDLYLIEGLGRWVGPWLQILNQGSDTMCKVLLHRAL